MTWLTPFTSSPRAAREDGEAIDRIEKLIGHKIARATNVADEPAAEAALSPPKAERPARSEKPAKAPRKAAATKPTPAVKEETPQKSAEPSPVVEDISNEWNGPMPSFLSVSAG